jgi:GNAT superfamily N-acetyltransferase
MDLLIRPARPGDRPAVFAIAAQIWEGHDYLPDVWEGWLHDPTGPLFVAVLDDIPIAVAKITLQSPTEAWLAGMRVDPAYRGRGVAAAVTVRQLQWLEERHVPIARLSTGHDNLPIHHLAGELGFRRIVAGDHWSRDLAQPAVGMSRILTPDEEPVAWELIARSSFLQVTQGLYGVGWTWMRWDRSRLQGHLARGEVWGWGTAPDALAIVVHRSARVPRYVSLVAGEREAGLALVCALGTVPRLVVEDADQPPQLRLAVLEGATDTAWIAERAGLAAGDYAMWLFERNSREVQR